MSENSMPNVPPPPSALPDFSKLGIVGSGSALPSANPFAPRTGSGSALPSASGGPPLPPPPSALPQPMAFPKPAGMNAVTTPSAPPVAFSLQSSGSGSTVESRPSHSPSPAPMPPPLNTITSQSSPRPTSHSPSPAPRPASHSPSPGRMSQPQSAASEPAQANALLECSVAALPPVTIPKDVPIKPAVLSPVALPPTSVPPQIAPSPVAPSAPPQPQILSTSTAPPAPSPQVPIAVQPGVPSQTAEKPVSNESPKIAGVSGDGGEGMFSWFSKQMQENAFLQQVAEKAKVGMETVLTTLDPGMKDFLSGDGIVEVYVGTEDPMLSSAIRQGFERVFHSAVVRGVPIPQVDAAPLCRGIANADAQCRVLATRLAASRLASPSSPFVVVQPLVLELDNKWSWCIRLHLRWRGEDMVSLSAPIALEDAVKEQLERAASATPRVDGGFPVTVEQAFAQVKGTTDGLLPFHQSELLILPAAMLAAEFHKKVEAERAKCKLPEKAPETAPK